MDELPKICQNCKREIPAANYTIHKAHCARNIKVCPVCKEPVPLADLEEHHEKLHKLLPCKQCGESVCGTDLEDHIRDSCAHTVKSCRFCELELPRRDLPAHENYCGVRTEQCPECREWVMIKYRQLHVDSNHGFLRLEEDPKPIPTPSTSTNNSRGPPKTVINRNISNVSQNQPVIESRNMNIERNRTGTNVSVITRSISEEPSTSRLNSDGTSLNGARPKTYLKRTNDQPQINTSVATMNKVNKELPVRNTGAIKKRPAPKPPVQPPLDPKRDLAYHSALLRQQQEDKKRREQNVINLAAGRPPVLSAAEKLERLRRMDALHNRELGTNEDYKNRLQGQVWGKHYEVPTGNRLGSTQSPESHNTNEKVESNKDDFRNLKPMTVEQFMDRFKELQLMAEQSEEAGGSRSNGAGNDRIKDIKSSLSQLRRGLNEIISSSNTTTDPNGSNGNDNRGSIGSNNRDSNGSNNRHNNGSNNIASNGSNNRAGIGSNIRASEGSNRTSNGSDNRGNNGSANNNRGSNGINNAQRPRLLSPQRTDEELNFQLPCEFCGLAIPAQDLVQHQTGCRPDLAQLRPRSRSPQRRSPRRRSPRPRSPPDSPPMPHPDPHDVPVIPCEFCTESLPVYLFTQHMEQCGRGNRLLYPD